jgi:exosortase
MLFPRRQGRHRGVVLLGSDFFSWRGGSAILTELNPQASLASSKESQSDPALSTEAGYLGLSVEAWLKVAILAPLFIAVYWLVLRWLWDKTNPFNGEANWGHAICIPLVGLYYLYINRDDLLRQPVEPVFFGSFTARHRLWPAVGMIALGGIGYLISKAGMISDSSGFLKAGCSAMGIYGVLVLLLDWGLASLLFGLALFAYGIWPGQNQFVQGCAMILTLFGVVLMLAGWRVMQFAYFPIFFLICGIPWPALVYSYIASPLQTLAAKVAVVSLRFTGVNAYRTGTKINMGGITEPLRTLNVAEACAGLRSLMTFITVGVAVAFLSARPLWQKCVITFSSIPIAIFCNVMRVAGQGLLDHYVSRQLSESFAHQFVGLVMLVPAFFMILLVGWVLDHVFVEEVDERSSSSASPAMAMGGGLVRDIPRKLRPVTALPAASAAHATPRVTAPAPTVAPKIAAPAPTVAPKPAAPVAPLKPVAPAPAPAPKPPAAPPAGTVPPRPPTAAPAPRSPGAPVVPPRPGIVPPRPNAPRPTNPQNRPVPPAQQPPRPPQPPKEGQ